MYWRRKKLMMMHEALHLRDDIDYLFQERMEAEEDF